MLSHIVFKLSSQCFKEATAIINGSLSVRHYTKTFIRPDLLYKVSKKRSFEFNEGNKNRSG